MTDDNCLSQQPGVRHCPLISHWHCSLYQQLLTQGEPVTLQKKIAKKKNYNMNVHAKNAPLLNTVKFVLHQISLKMQVWNSAVTAKQRQWWFFCTHLCHLTTDAAWDGCGGSPVDALPPSLTPAARYWKQPVLLCPVLSVIATEK